MTQLRVGQEINGYCYGQFGRDGYDNRRVEAIGVDWVVLRTSDGRPVIFTGNPDELAEHAANWARENGDDG